jgi:hypothetical protein
MNKHYTNAPTGNIAADMVYDCCMFYKQRRKKVSVVSLSHTYWKIFKEWMKRNAPEIPIDDDGVQFNNTTIKKGHRWMSRALEVEFAKEVKSDA